MVTELYGLGRSALLCCILSGEVLLKVFILVYLVLVLPLVYAAYLTRAKTIAIVLFGSFEVVYSLNVKMRTFRERIQQDNALSG